MHLRNTKGILELVGFPVFSACLPCMSFDTQHQVGRGEDSHTLRLERRATLWKTTADRQAGKDRQEGV